MHPSSVENMKKIREQYLQYLSDIKNPKVCDVGGLYDQPHKTYLRLFEDIPGLEWVVCDIKAHPSVDYVMTGPYRLPFADETFDLVISGQMLEHCSNPFKSVAEMKRVLKVGCCLALAAPSAGPRHDKQDGWRFMDDGFRFIAEDVGGIEIVADWIDYDAPDERSRKWQDHLFVGKRIR